MNKRQHSLIRTIFATVATLVLPVSSLAQVQLKVIISGGFMKAYQGALPEFERASGITVTTNGGASQGTGPNTIDAQLQRGVPADVVILSKEGLTDLIADGRIAVGTGVDLAQSPLGVSVRAGTPKPDIRTVKAFKQTMLQAKSVTFPFSTTGIYVKDKLFPRLGIAEEMAGKITSSGVAAVTKGEAEIAIQPLSELLHAEGTDFVGLVPEEIQYMSVFSAAVVANSKQVAAGKQLIAFLASAKATKAIKDSGMEPLGRR